MEKQLQRHANHEDSFVTGCPLIWMQILTFVALCEERLCRTQTSKSKPTIFVCIVFSRLEVRPRGDYQSSVIMTQKR